MGMLMGYWLVAEDGGVFPFGNAPFWGSSGGTGKEVTSIVSFPAPAANNEDPETTGYAWVDTDANLTVVHRPSNSRPLSAGPSEHDRN
jgi:hypothetical protein